jgi:hypothetical protein
MVRRGLTTGPPGDGRRPARLAIGAGNGQDNGVKILEPARSHRMAAQGLGNGPIHRRDSGRPGLEHQPDGPQTTPKGGSPWHAA